MQFLESSQNTLIGTKGDTLFVSNDAGSNWDYRIIGLENDYISVIEGLSPEEFYTGTDYGVYKTTDGGITWEAKNSGINIGWINVLGISQSNPEIIYGATDRSSDKFMYKTTDSGKTWNKVSIPSVDILKVRPKFGMKL